MSAKPYAYQSLAIPRYLSFSGSTSSSFAAANPTLGLGESSMRAAGFSDAELDFADMFEGYAVVDMLVEDLRLQSGNALCGFFSCSANALFPGSSLGLRSNNALLALELSGVPE